VESLSNGWTGGQYSGFRAVLGLLLAACGGPWLVYGLTAREAASGLLVMVFGAMLALGWRDRIAAVVLAAAWLWGETALHVPGPRAFAVVALLLVHAALPRAPYGSLDAVGRSDPGGGWRFPPAVFALVWILLSLGYVYSGFERGVPAHGQNRPTLRSSARVGELLFAPIALRPELRVWAWLFMLLAQIAWIAAIGPGPLGYGLLALHVLAFDPGWVRPRPAAGPEWLFYDGTCGLCHRAVRFVLAEDTAAAFRLAPLFSERFRLVVPEAERAALPDSLVVQTADGRRLVRSGAVIHLLARLGGIWRVAAAVGSLVPAAIRDRVYDSIAGVRYRLFAPPLEACPIVPPHLRARFDD
jgi:predicted DCC family thiol-disulfide oxidoreductase YuxK